MSKSTSIETFENKYHLKLTHIDGTQNCEQAEQELLDQGLSESEVGLLLGDEPRPLFEQTNHTDFVLILRGINFDKEDDKHTLSVRISNHNNHLFVAHRKRVKSLDETLKEFEKYENSEIYVKELLEKLTSKIERYIFKLEEKVDDIEEAMLSHPDQQARQSIMQMRRQVIELRRYLLPQREVINQLSRNSLANTDDDSRHQLTDLAQRTARICDLLDALRERLSLIQEEIGSMISDKLNQNLYILAIISAIFLPLGFLTGLLGINVGGMPGADQSSAFWVVCVLSALLGIGIFAFLKSRKWF